MRSFDPALAAHLAARRPMIARHLLWVSARNRSTGATESLGLWTGEYSRSFIIDGVARDYYGVGAILEMPQINGQIGIEVRSHAVTLSALSTEAQQLIRGYDPRLAPAEIHRVLFDPDAPATVIGAPVRMLRGWIDGVSFNESGSGDHTIELTLVSHARGLTVPLPLKRSDASYRLRGDDRIGRYCDVSGAVPIYWGEARRVEKTSLAGLLSR